MATMTRRKPAPRRAQAAPRANAAARSSSGARRAPSRMAAPLKPGIATARNWAAGQMRAATYSRRAAMRMAGVLSGVVSFVLFMGLWLSGALPHVQSGIATASQNRLMAMGFVVKRVDVVGEGRLMEDEVRAALGIAPGDFLFGADLRAAQLRVQSLSWVEDAMVRRLWPNQYVVHIIERTPVALWQQEGVLAVIDTEGRIIEAAQPTQFAQLPLIVGKGAASQSQGLYDTLQSFAVISARVEAIIRVGERRWDITLKNGGARVLLPRLRPERALTTLEALHKSHGILDLDVETIDLRVAGRVILRPRAEMGGALYATRKRSAA